MSDNVSLVRSKEWCKRPSYFHYIGFLLDDSHSITFKFRETCRRDRLTQISKENGLGQCYTTVVCTESERIFNFNSSRLSGNIVLFIQAEQYQKIKVSLVRNCVMIIGIYHCIMLYVLRLHQSIHEFQNMCD